MQEFKVCCFTGYRPQSLPFGFDLSGIELRNKLMDQIIILIEMHSVKHFISGMALGVEQFAAEIILELKKTYPDITLEGVIPYETQAIKWTIAQRDRYFSILERCDKETLLQQHYTSNNRKKLNEYMIKRSDYLVAVCSGKSGETGQTLACARFFKRNIIVINPNTLNVIQWS